MASLLLLLEGMDIQTFGIAGSFSSELAHETGHFYGCRMISFRNSVALGFMFASVVSTVAQSPSVLNGVAAIVNDQVITAEGVEAFAEPSLRSAVSKARNRSQWAEQELSIKKSALEELINRKLILSEFKEKGYNMPDSLIDDIVNSEVRSKFRDRLTLTKELQARNQTYEDYRKQVKEDFIVAQMRKKNVSSLIIISPKKIESYYQANLEKFRINEQVKLRMIVLDKKKRPEGETRKLADDIVSKVRRGGSFAELATSFSDDAARTKGGDRGWVENQESQLRKELREVAFQLQASQVSDPVEVENVIFILQAEEKKPAGQRALNDVRNEIESTLKAEEFDRLVSNWMKRLRQKSFVRYF